MTNLTQHPCSDKCSDFKGEQCHHCLIPGNSEISNSSDFIMGDDAHIENKMLHEAAATHLKNQMHFKKLYDALVEQLYPYAIDLEEPVDGDVNITSQEFINGYNRALECVHYNLLEMMKSDEEYIRAQCGMLGGGGAA